MEKQTPRAIWAATEAEGRSAIRLMRRSMGSPRMASTSFWAFPMPCRLSENFAGSRRDGPYGECNEVRKQLSAGYRPWTVCRTGEHPRGLYLNVFTMAAPPSTKKCRLSYAFTVAETSTANPTTMTAASSRWAFPTAASYGVFFLVRLKRQ